MPRLSGHSLLGSWKQLPINKQEEGTQSSAALCPDMLERQRAPVETWEGAQRLAELPILDIS